MIPALHQTFFDLQRCLTSAPVLPAISARRGGHLESTRGDSGFHSLGKQLQFQRQQQLDIGTLVNSVANMEATEQATAKTPHGSASTSKPDGKEKTPPTLPEKKPAQPMEIQGAVPHKRRLSRAEQANWHNFQKDMGWAEVLEECPRAGREIVRRVPRDEPGLDPDSDTGQMDNV